jgi:rod shape-determining protein MreC
MDSLLGRYRNLIILVGVLFLQVLGLATQVKRGNDQERTRLIRVWVVSALSPFERGLLWVENGTGDIWHNYFYLRGVRAENRQLKEQIEQMRLEQVRLSEDAAQAHRLQTLLAFKEQYIARTVAAQVIGTSGTDSNRVIYIDKGEDAGIKRDMAVITADGIVGKVMLAYRSEAQVLLINDMSSGVGVILGDTRLQGVLVGTVNGEVVLNDVMSDEQVPVGEKVLTSGGDQIFPKGLPVGTVAKVANGKELFLNIKIKPAANLSRLEEVLVLVDKQERQATAEDNTRVRAADILAQRLPSVPEKPADGAAGNSASGNSTPPDAATKPANGAVTKPQADAASVGSNPRPSSTGMNGSASQNSAVSKSIATPGTANAPTAAPKKTAGETATGSNANSSQTKSASTQPKPIKPVSSPSATNQPLNPQSIQPVADSDTQH